VEALVKLPNDSIGISDINEYRDCPQSFVFGMRRHVELPERLQLEPGERDEAPESVAASTVYGSAIHEAISHVETGHTHEVAIDLALQVYGTWLTPDDVQLLREDLDTYELRHPRDAELVACERDMRVPLFVDDDGTQIYYRFKLDVLFRLKAHPDVYIHRDYKSSAHRKTSVEVHKDPQMWSYNWAIHELWPECRQLFQEYDQLKFGVERTSKNDQQRAQIKQWLIDNVKIILRDETFKPKINEWCRWCPLVVTCRETHRATEFWRGRLALTAPMTKEGAKVKVALLDEGLELERLIRDELPRMQQARKHIEHVEKLLKSVIEGMSLEERERVGWRISERRSKTIPPEALRELHSMLGDSFYHLVSMSMKRLEDFVGAPKKGEPVPAELQLARDMALEDTTSSTLVAAN
jgi:hypothetical protein